MLDQMQVTGIVHRIMDTQQISEKFCKKDIIVKTEGEYPQYIPIQFTNKNVDKLDHVTTGSRVTVNINLRGREWKDPKGEIKYFGTIEGWSIKTDNQTFDRSVEKEKYDPTVQDDDLPF